VSRDFGDLCLRPNFRDQPTKEEEHHHAPHDPIRLSAYDAEYLLLNPRGVRKAPRNEQPYDHKPTLHVPGCASLGRTDEAKPVKVPAIVLDLFDRNEVWYCHVCLADGPGSE
jgi:hypothetical protein